jgi:tRNA nucleotidyltransferase (CCA-adding enzyme)
MKKKTNLQKRKEIYNKVLKKITPSKKDLEEEKEIFKEIKEKIENAKGSHSHVEWCGSSARGTHLKGDRDLDLFVMFDEKMKTKELESEGLRIGKMVFRGHKWEKAYSQHPYIRGVIKGFEVEIVPSYIVKDASKRKSAVDRTPFHNKYLLKKLTKKQKQDVRLLKQFLKGINAYGADLKNRSLPGYGVELLILKFGNFEKTLKSISKWGEETKIKFNSKKTTTTLEGTLIIVDPVDHNRNVASAVSEEQYQRIIFASNEFLRNPKIKFFFRKEKKPLKKTEVKKLFKQKEVILIKSSFPKKELEDIVWGQIRRLVKKITNHLNKNDFEVTNEKIYSEGNDLYFFFELSSTNIQKSKKLIGPKVIDEENTKKFLSNKKNIISGPRIEDSRIVLEVPRKYTNAIKLIKDFIKENKKIERKAVKSILKKSKILEEEDILDNYKGELKVVLSDYLRGKEIFE